MSDWLKCIRHTNRRKFIKKDGCRYRNIFWQRCSYIITSASTCTLTFAALISMLLFTPKWSVTNFVMQSTPLIQTNTLLIIVYSYRTFINLFNNNINIFYWSNDTLTELSYRISLKFKVVHVLHHLFYLIEPKTHII